MGRNIFILVMAGILVAACGRTASLGPAASPTQTPPATEPLLSSNPQPEPTSVPAGQQAASATPTASRGAGDDATLVSAATATARPVPIEIVPSTGGTPVPASALFDLDWDDRAVFRAGLIAAEQGVLDALPGATVYHIALDIADDLLHLEGQEQVRYTNLETIPLDEIYFRLYPNLLGGSATVSNLSVNGLPVEPSLEAEDSALRVPLPQPLAPGEQLVLGLDFAVEVPDAAGANYGIFVFDEDVLTLAHTYPMVAVYDRQGWNIEIPPQIGDVLYADTSFYLVRVSAPANLTFVASGITIDREEAGEGQVLTFAGGPMRDFYLAASELYTVVSRAVGPTTVNSYAPGDLIDGAELALDYAVRSLKSYNTRFGDYPFTEFDLVGTPTLALGVEYPGIVAITLDVYDPAVSFGGFSARVLLEATTAHEVAHQWWYSIVGNDQVDEPWLDEALTQYSTLLYYVDSAGPIAADGFRRTLYGRWDRLERADIPLGLPVEAYDDRAYSAIIYGRGPIFFETLADTIGEEDFDAFARDYYQTFQWGLATTADLKRVAERNCACDLTSLFEEWVYE
jgi:hypothetical protein